MIPYQTKTKKLPGARYTEIRNQSLFIFNQIKRSTKRKPYIRSAYFNKQKIFFDYFWAHLFQKNPRERTIRLKYFDTALEVIKKSRNHPSSQKNSDKKRETFYRLAGLTAEKELFIVQIKENNKTGKKYFMSCFPWKTKTPCQ